MDRAEADLPSPTRLTLFSEQARACPHLGGFFPGTEIVGWPAALRCETWAGWGLKPMSRAAAAAARVFGRRFLRLEDGFLRSVGLAKGGAPLVSIVLDDTGIFYSAQAPSRLERLIASSTTAAWKARGARVRRLVVERRLSKYNALPDRPVDMAPDGRRRLLLIDQVRGDLSIAGSLSDAATFARMVATARRERPEAALLVRTHPDVTAGYRKGYLTDPIAGAEPVSDAVDTHAVLDIADEVWTVSSQIGFEALLRGIPVTTFGVPFYAGYGLTRDRAEGALAAEVLARRRAPAGVDTDALAAAALVRYARYCDPATGQALEAEQAIALLGELRAQRDGDGTVAARS